MKISRKTLSAFNAGKESKFNNHWNKAMGYPTIQEYYFLSSIQRSLSGMMREKLTMKQIEEWLSRNTYVSDPRLDRLAGEVV